MGGLEVNIYSFSALAPGDISSESAFDADLTSGKEPLISTDQAGGVGRRKGQEFSRKKKFVNFA